MKLNLLAAARVAALSCVSLCIGPAANAFQGAPPAPRLSAPANGAALVQPIALRWVAVTDPDGPIGSYTWQVSASASFTSVIASGATNFGRPDVPLATQDQFSGLANGTYFWRVRCSQTIGGPTGFADSAWSTVRSFTVTGLGPAPAGVPSITSPSSGARFHPYEFFDLVWTAVPGAHHYVLEADEDAGFAHPINLSGGPLIVFGTQYHVGWGNTLTANYRVRAVNADGVWGRPSATTQIVISNTAPLTPAPALSFPTNGASVSVPFTFDWANVANQQIPGFDLDVDDEPNFLGDFGVLLVQNVSRSDYMLAEPLAPGTYFWRIRALNGNAFGPWSAGQRFVVTAPPPTPPGLVPFWLIADPGTTYGGASTAARITLTEPAPPGGALVRIASDFPGIEMPVTTVLVPAGETDATVGPITTPAVFGATVSTMRAAYGGAWVQSSIGCFPVLWGGASLSTENVVGGNSLTCTVTLLNPAPAGGLAVTLLGSDTALARPPPNVLVPAGETSATFAITTAAVSVPTRVVFGFGAVLDGSRAPDVQLVLWPASQPPTAAELASLVLLPPSVVGGGTSTGRVTLTAPAPAGGALIRLLGSLEGTVVVPPNVTVPAGSTTADFPITPGLVVQPHWIAIQAAYGFEGAIHNSTLAVTPGGTGTPALFAFDAQPNQLIGGNNVRGTVGLAVPAPSGGASVALVSSNTSVVQVPASVFVPAGHSVASFTVTTSAVPSGASAWIDATAGGQTKTAFLYLGANPNAPLALNSITPSVSGAVGGHAINVTLFLNGNAPAGGAVVALSSSNTAAAQVPANVTVPAGLGFASFNVTTSNVATDTPVTITGTLGVSRTAVLTVLAPPPDTTAPMVAITAPSAGASVSGSVSVTASASDDVGVTRVEFRVDGALLATDTSAPYAATWNASAAGAHTLTASAFDAAGHQTNSTPVSVTVPSAPPPASLALALTGVPATIPRGQFFNAVAGVANSGGSASSGNTVVVSFTPSDALRRDNPQGTTQTVPAVAPGGSQSVTWRMRAERSGSVTLTMTLRNASGATIATASRSLTITN